MSQSPKQPTSEKEQKDWKSKGNRALIINIIFFILLIGCIFLIPVTSFEVTVVVMFVVFIACILYIYFF